MNPHESAWRWNNFKTHLCCTTKTSFVKLKPPCWVPNYISHLHFIWDSLHIPALSCWASPRGAECSKVQKVKHKSVQNPASTKAVAEFGGRNQKRTISNLKLSSWAVHFSWHWRKILTKHSLGSNIEWGQWEKLPDQKWPTDFCQRFLGILTLKA